MEGSLVDTRAYLPYTLGGPPVWGLVLDPLAAYTSTTVYIWRLLPMNVYDFTLPYTIDGEKVGCWIVSKYKRNA